MEIKDNPVEINFISIRIKREKEFHRITLRFRILTS